MRKESMKARRLEIPIDQQDTARGADVIRAEDITDVRERHRVGGAAFVRIKRDDLPDRHPVVHLDHAPGYDAGGGGAAIGRTLNSNVSQSMPGSRDARTRSSIRVNS